MAAAACVILLILCILLVIYIVSMKRQAGNIVRELRRTREKTYNRDLKVTLFDKDINELAAEINRNLDYQKTMKLEAERSQKQLKQSVSDIAHDLRTPLTVVKGNLQMLDREEPLSERGKDHLRISIEKTEALKEMVDDFFELSVIESDSEKVNLTEIDVTAFLTQFVIDNEAVIRDQNLTPKLYLPEKSVFIKADKMLLKRMCNNLLNNVLKYAKDEFEVSLQCELISDHEKVFSNDGKGDYIVTARPQEKREDSSYVNEKVKGKEERVSIVFSNNVPEGSTFDVTQLFDRTYRGDKARPSGGAGLGLYIVKLLAEKQGASVSASMAENTLYIRMEFC